MQTRWSWASFLSPAFLSPCLCPCIGAPREQAVSATGDRGSWMSAAAAAAKSLQSCPTLCNPMDGSPPGSPVPGILQARTLEWVAIFFSNAWKWKVKVKSLSRVRLQATPWTAAFQAPPSMGFSRQEYWSEVSLPSPTHSHFPCFPTGEHLSYCKYQYGQFSKGGRLLFPASQVFRSQWFWLMSWEQKLLSRISAKLLKSGKQGLPRWSNS